MTAKLLATVGLLVLAVAVLLGLGTWQVYRYFDKQSTEQRFDERIAQPPVEWSGVAAPTTNDVDFRRVHLAGAWDNAHAMFITARMRYGILGEELVTPLQPDNGGPAVLVNRGWYPVTERAGVLPGLLAEERADIEGLGREAPDARASRTPEGHWSWLDTVGMAAELPYPVVPWMVIQGTRATGEESRDPQQGLPVQVYSGFRADTPHVEYAATWYGLALALVAVALLRFRQRGQGDPSLAIPPLPEQPTAPRRPHQAP